MMLLDKVSARVRPLAERLDALSLRERGMLFGAGVVLIYVAWQWLVMDPLTHRAQAAERRLVEARRSIEALTAVGTADARDPAMAAAASNRALEQRLRALDAELARAAAGYVAPERMTEVLRQMLAAQQSLRLVSLNNLPVESLSATPGSHEPPAATDRGPFLHPVEIVVEGDFAGVVAYVNALEALPWRMHWSSLELVAGDYPVNRVKIVIGALSLSRDWMSV